MFQRASLANIDMFALCVFASTSLKFTRLGMNHLLLLTPWSPRAATGATISCDSCQLSRLSCTSRDVWVDYFPPHPSPPLPPSPSPLHLIDLGELTYDIFDTDI